MQLSGEEFLRVSRSSAREDAESSPSLGKMSTARARSAASLAETEEMDIASHRDEVTMVVASVSRAADVREQVIASLRERIQSGDYVVSGEQVAEMMVRRLLADRIR
jgi:Anti-sigma-28 factor, FlgM.